MAKLIQRNAILSEVLPKILIEVHGEFKNARKRKLSIVDFVVAAMPQPLTTLDLLFWNGTTFFLVLFLFTHTFLPLSASSIIAPISSLEYPCSFCVALTCVSQCA